MTEYPNRYVISGRVASDAAHVRIKQGDKVWLYWEPEGGGWWQWGPEGWACRFEEKSGSRYEDAIKCAPTAGPWYSKPDPKSIKAIAVHAIVTVS